MRPQSGSGLQSYYANQRFGPRPGEPDQMMQAKRRMAAQRERELRNYHQEQQYQKHVSGAKSDRSMSPNTGMSEEERRELIARQHRALYGNDSNLYSDQTSRPGSQDARVATTMGVRGGSPLARGVAPPSAGSFGASPHHGRASTPDTQCPRGTRGTRTWTREWSLGSSRISPAFCVAAKIFARF